MNKETLWRLFRPHTLTASSMPVLIGSALAWRQNGSLHLGLMAAMFIAATLIQAATNMFNEYYDYKRGLDSKESVGIAGAITREGVKPRIVLHLALTCIVLALFLGAYICSLSSWYLAVIGLVCILAAYFYNGGPYPISYTPFGELVAGFFMGSGIILISFFIQTGTVTGGCLLISLPVFILIGAILMANNIRDREGDQKNGRRTLAILLGHQRAVWFLGGMLVLAYLWTIVLILLKLLPPWAALVLLSMPKAVKDVSGFRNKNTPREMMASMKGVAATNTIYGLLLILGLILG